MISYVLDFWHACQDIKRVMVGPHRLEVREVEPGRWVAVLVVPIGQRENDDGLPGWLRRASGIVNTD